VERRSLPPPVQPGLWESGDTKQFGLHRWPKHLDEEVARLQRERIGVKLT